MEPEHTGDVTEFNVAEGLGLTLTVAVEVRVELEQPLKVNVSFEVTEIRETSVLAVRGEVVIVPEEVKNFAVFVVDPSR